MKDGWKVIYFSPESKAVISEVIALFERRLRAPLSDYREENDEAHIRTQVELANLMLEKRIARRIIIGSIDQFRELLGRDLHIQKYPYLRIARPGKAQDNIGIHRDTKYGSTPFECSVVIPLTEMPPEGALQVVDGSHVKSEAAYPARAIKTGVEKNSDRHRLGFVYSKKQLADDIDAHPVEVHVGNGLLFPLSLVHGQEVNRSTMPRFSIDVRLVNSLADIEWSRTVHQDYWEPLCECPVTAEARAYYAAQA